MIAAISFIVIFVTSHLAASTFTSTTDCSVSITGAGYNLTSAYSGPSGSDSCNLNVSSALSARVSGSGQGFGVSAWNFNPDITIAATGTVSQAEQFNQMVLGGTGDATLRVNYQWGWSYGDTTPEGLAGLTEAEPVFFFNGAPIASVKTDLSRLRSCGGFGNCYLWVYTVDMPITFGVPFTRAWTQSFTDSFQVTGKPAWYLGTHMMIPSSVSPAPNIYLDTTVLVDGNPVAFTLLDVPEPGTWKLFASAVGVLLLLHMRP